MSVLFGIACQPLDGCCNTASTTCISVLDMLTCQCLSNHARYIEKMAIFDMICLGKFTLKNALTNIFVRVVGYFSLWRYNEVFIIPPWFHILIKRIVLHMCDCINTINTCTSENINKISENEYETHFWYYWKVNVETLWYILKAGMLT